MNKHYISKPLCVVCLWVCVFTYTYACVLVVTRFVTEYLTFDCGRIPLILHNYLPLFMNWVFNFYSCKYVSK